MKIIAQFPHLWAKLSAPSVLAKCIQFHSMFIVILKVYSSTIIGIVKFKCYIPTYIHMGFATVCYSYSYLEYYLYFVTYKVKIDLKDNQGSQNVTHSLLRFPLFSLCCKSSFKIFEFNDIC